MDRRTFVSSVLAATGISALLAVSEMVSPVSAARRGQTASVPGGTLPTVDIDFARRPTPTPTPVKCPGIQVAVNGVCTCPPEHPSKCGPTCCNTAAQCCDGACCGAGFICDPHNEETCIPIA